MKILVPVKRVVDAYVTVRVAPDESGVVTDGVKMSMNPFCEIALEEAIRLREKGLAEEVIAVTIGESVAQDVLRTALAVGASRALRVEAAALTEPLALAKLLRSLVEQEGIGLCLMGKQAIDGDHNQTGQMLSALLGWGLATSVSQMELQGERLRVTRETDGGLQIRELKLPAVLTVDLRLNEPRYASLPNIMRSRKIPIETLTPESLGVSIAPRTRTLSVVSPPQRTSGQQVETAEELVAALRDKEKVL